MVAILLIGIIAAVIIAALVGLWVFGVLVMMDMSVKSERIIKPMKVLVIFPHADDEVLHCGGTIRRIVQHGGSVTHIILTKGERGTPDAHRDNSLKNIRPKEAVCAAEVFGTTKLIQKDFGDLQLADKKPQLQQYLTKAIAAEQPDLVLTYDQAGLYGHPDHITCSEIVTDLVRRKFPGIQLWYPCFPKRLFRLVKLPEHMANDPAFRNKRAVPHIKLFVWPYALAKNRAANCYKSQSASNRIVPIPLLPMWYFYTMIAYEYFEVVS